MKAMLIVALTSITLVCAIVEASKSSALVQQPVVVNRAILEDFSDIVTPSDLGFNDFAGNVGAANKDNLDYGSATLDTVSNEKPVMRFDWDFSISSDMGAFTGLFFSIFGLTDTQTTYDGQNITQVYFPEHSLNLDDIDAPLIEPGGPRRFNSVSIELKYTLPQDVTLRLELKDTQDGGRFIRFPITGSGQSQTITWDFRQIFQSIDGKDLDLSRAKVLSIVIERQNVADNVLNPSSGSLEIHSIWFTPDRPETEPVNDQQLLDLIERRACQYFFDWSSRKAESLGVPQDRSTFGDLLTVGGIGFALPAYAIAAQRGWVSRQNAAARTLSVLQLLSDPDAFGPEAQGRIGHKGWFYHFLGPDGKRKLNFDFAETPANEALNTVELSTIDTGLAIMGVLAAQSYFTGNDATETEIRNLAQMIYDNVDWGFMLELSSKQFYLGWKPNEQRDINPAFNIPDADGLGQYSGELIDAATLDYYTDEAFIVTLLAAGSITHPVPAEVHCAWFRNLDQNGLVRTFPGSLFTYQFLSAFIDTRNLNTGFCPNGGAINWYDNSRKAILSTIDYAETQASMYQTYGPNAWGLSAAEGPDGRYQAYGAPPVAVNQIPDQDGTITYYGMLSSVSFGNDLLLRVIQVLRNAWQRGDWHYRFALPDAFNDEISQANMQGGSSLLRQTGPWKQRALFAIDQGPMLLHLENQRSGLIWNLLNQNPNIQRAINRLKTELPVKYSLEGEDGSGDGNFAFRSEASNNATIHMYSGQTRTYDFQLSNPICFNVEVRYSNDNAANQPFEVVEIRIDGIPVGHFTSMNTGSGGLGWNNFLWSGSIGNISLGAGPHQLTALISSGDDFGFEIDVITLTEADCGGSLGYESDVAPRPAGSGTVVVSDWVQVGRFSVGLDTPTPGSEFQRADCAPRATLGDGKITVADWVQAGRYSVGLDPLLAAGGPNQVTMALHPFQEKFEAPRRIRLDNINPRSNRGNYILIPVTLLSSGGENAVIFSIQYDPTMLSFAAFETGRDLLFGIKPLILANHSRKGQVKIAIALPPGIGFQPGGSEMMVIKFRRKTFGTKDPAIKLIDTPGAIELADVRGNLISIK